MAARRTMKILAIFGTRPEAIKMAPVIAALRDSGWAKCQVIATAQHRGLLDQILAHFEIVPDVDLDLMTEGQSMVDLSSRMLPALAGAISRLGAQVVLAQGDTATVFVASLAAFYAGLPFGHVEAGLRTHDIREPFPEEGFRQMAARLAHWHFAPTEGAAENLRRENVRGEIHVTGNTGIDALLSTVARLPARSPSAASRSVLLTAHRRESFGEPMRRIFRAARAIADAFPDVQLHCPVHPNPNVKALAQEHLGGHARIHLSEPLDYPGIVQAMAASHFILTDSGGIQEEAPALGKPVLVLREQTERPEAVVAGVARVVGTDEARIVAEATRLLVDPEHFAAMSAGASPYGDGHAAPRILSVLRAQLLPGA
jgi:UDP-N-acetylglucosamine 2-epimerase (non-hydrolysing)